MPKHKLDEVALVPHVAAFGISCHVPDYRLCWSLNRAFGLRLERRAKDIVERSKDKELRFTVFEHRDEHGEPLWTLVCNTCGKRRLIGGQKEADFFLLIDEDAAERESGLAARLRACEFVLMAYPIDLNEMPQGHKLLL